jgi:maltose alpha-D-glucosyltransferase/alpha-amylase
LADTLPLNGGTGDPRLVLCEASYSDGDSETYALVLGLGPRAESSVARVLVRSKAGGPGGVVVEQGEDPATAVRLFDLVKERRRVVGARAGMAGVPTELLRALRDEVLPARRLGTDQSNSCFVLGDKVLCKLIRKIDPGPSIELEILRHLDRHGAELRVPALLGHVALRRRGVPESTLAILQRFVPNQGDGWRLAVDHARRFYEQILIGHFARHDSPVLSDRVVGAMDQQLSAAHTELFGSFPPQLELLGRRTAELHLALATPSEVGDFGVESFGALARRSSYQSARNTARHSVDLLRERLRALPERLRRKATMVLERERQIHTRLRRWLDRADYGRRIRVHGDYHLGQVLTTGSDFVIIDFEGEPARPLAERRRKRSPLTDLAGMLRSIHYAAFGVLAGDVPGSEVRPEDRRLLEPWAHAWYRWCGSRFVRGYLATTGISALLPAGRDELEALLDVHLLEKALYEVAYELNSRPAWLGVPLRGVLDQLGTIPEVPL